MSFQRYSVLVDQDKCIGCGACDRACPAVVFQILAGTADPVRSEECWGPICESCLEECPQDAISIQPFKASADVGELPPDWTWVK